MCSRQLIGSHSALRLAELEQTTVGLHQELARLRLENSRLQERNLQLAAELAVRPGPSPPSGLPPPRGVPPRAEESADEEGVSDSIETAMPGDSFPAVAASLDIISDGEVTEGEETEQQGGGGQDSSDTSRLLARLTRGGSRMEQIKRQLVVQRGAIVSALRLLAESRSQSSRSQSLESQGEGEQERNGGVSEVKLCPMCEAHFPLGAEDQFEQHVMDHFVWDSDQDTLLYMGEEQEASERL